MGRAKELSIKTAAGRNEFRRLYREGKSQAEIAEIFGVEKQTIYHWARDLQLEKRKPGRRPGKTAPKDSGEQKRTGWSTKSIDSPEAIQICLNCKRADCPGNCDEVRYL